MLHDIISPYQSAFILGRMITDNALIAFECIRKIQKACDTLTKFCAYKLDLTKAYDRVDWRFLQGALEKMGFEQQWIKWVMACVSSVSYSVCFNGHLLKSFKPLRGLRQGDPLSPYLFLFVVEGLSTSLSKVVERNEL